MVFRADGELKKLLSVALEALRWVRGRRDWGSFSGVTHLLKREVDTQMAEGRDSISQPHFHTSCVSFFLPLSCFSTLLTTGSDRHWSKESSGGQGPGLMRVCGGKVYIKKFIVLLSIVRPDEVSHFLASTDCGSGSRIVTVILCFSKTIQSHHLKLEAGNSIGSHMCMLTHTGTHRGNSEQLFSCHTGGRWSHFLLMITLYVFGAHRDSCVCMHVPLCTCRNERSVNRIRCSPSTTCTQRIECRS